jgi:hypothetical protein
MSLNDALALAGQVLTDYAASGLADAPGAERIWPDRLAHALRDLTVAAAAWYAAPAGDPSAAALAGAVRQLEDGVAGVEAEAARLDRAAELAARHAGRGGPGRARDALARLVWSWASRSARRIPEPGAVALSAAEAETAWQALGDAAAWRAGQTDDEDGCFGCVRARARARAGHAPDPGLARCPEHARYDTIVADYAALRLRLGGGSR